VTTKGKTRKQPDTITFAEIAAIFDPEAVPDNTRRYNALRKRMNDWTKRGWIKRYGLNRYSGRSLMQTLVDKRLKGITSGTEKVVDIDLMKFKTLRKKYKADLEEARADIFDREAFRGEYVSDYISSTLVGFSAAIMRHVYEVPHSAYGEDDLHTVKDDMYIRYRNSVRMVLERIDFHEAFLPFIDNMENDKEL